VAITSSDIRSYSASALISRRISGTSRGVARSILSPSLVPSIPVAVLSTMPFIRRSRRRRRVSSFLALITKNVQTFWYPGGWARKKLNACAFALNLRAIAASKVCGRFSNEYSPAFFGSRRS